MTRYVVMPRGINVGSNNRVPMAGLRDALEAHGCTDVTTVLQSGNVILSSGLSAGKLTTLVEKVLDEEFGAKVPCLVRTAAALKAIQKKNPLGSVAEDPARYLVMFFSAAPAKDAVAEIEKQDHDPEVIAFDGTEAYVWTPDGVKGMTLSNTALEKKLGVAVTARNWNALGKIVGKL